MVAHGLSALRHVELSQTKDQTCVLCVGRQIFNRGAAREVQSSTVNCQGMFDGRIPTCCLS